MKFLSVFIFMPLLLNASSALKLHYSVVVQKNYRGAFEVIKNTQNYCDLKIWQKDALFSVVLIEDERSQKQILSLMYKKFGEDIDPLALNPEGKDVWGRLNEKIISQDSLIKEKHRLNFVKNIVKFGKIKPKKIMNYLYDQAVEGNDPRYLRILLKIAPHKLMLPIPDALDDSKETCVVSTQKTPDPVAKKKPNHHKALVLIDLEDKDMSY